MPAPFQVEVPATGQVLWSVDYQGNVVQAGNLSVEGFPSNVGPFAPVVSPANTVTGVTALTKLADGIVIPAGGLQPGQLYRMVAFGQITTTVDTQTVKIGLYLGGIAGTDVLDFGAQEPNSAATVTNASWSVTFEMLALSSTAVACWGWDGLNFSPSTINQAQSVAVTNTAAEELVIGVTPSATAVSITARAYCMRVF